MKRAYLLFFVIIISTLFNACTEITEIQGKKEFYGYDFTEYSKKDFLFTPEKYLGEYESIGLFTLVVTPTIKKVPKGLYSDIDGKVIKPEVEEGYERREATGGEDVLVEILDPASAIKLAYKKAVALGADAIVNFKIEDELYEGLGIKYFGIKVSGFAIKRKNAVGY